MKDRIKRRGRKPAGSKDNLPAPEPLQPKYFDTDIPEKTFVVPEKTPAPEAAEPRQPEGESQPKRESQVDFGIRSSEVAPQAQPEPAPTRRRDDSAARPARGQRRRRRGGRGEGRLSPAAPASAATSETTSGHEPARKLESAAIEPAVPADALPVPNAVIAGPPEPASADTVAAELRPAAPQAAARPSKGAVVLAIGLPGSGKSSWFKRHNIRPLSSDLLRELLFDDAEEQRFQDLVFSNLRSMLKARLIARRPMSYIDATNLNPHERHSWIKLAKDYGYDVQGLFFDVPLEVCLERHARRGREVPEDIMRKMAAKLKPPTFEEGFSKITVVRVKKKE